MNNTFSMTGRMQDLVKCVVGGGPHNPAQPDFADITKRVKMSLDPVVYFPEDSRSFWGFHMHLLL